ncbi:MAG TPA: lysylphosphatidylglycerol synthase transmembrane domain-containing protein [Kofleriaceae bacterium]|nr:lysylphosphatidylglycerol synthase transmembrane domain-containing protein [Kofleriaceae bacterium]
MTEGNRSSAPAAKTGGATLARGNPRGVTSPRAPGPGSGDEARPEPGRHLGARIFNLVMFVIGGLALGWMLSHLSWEDVRHQLTRLGVWFPAILALELTALCCDAAALHAFMRPEARMISYWRVLAAQASGRAINVLTPGGALGEASKLTMLVHHAPRARVLSSIVLLNLGDIYLSATVMLIGIPITLLLVDLPHGAKVTVGIGLAVIVPLLVLLGVVIHRGAVSTVVGALRRLRVISAGRARIWKTRLVEVDRHIRELHQHRSAGTWRGILWVLASRVLSWTGTVLLLAATGVPLTVALILGVLSIGVLISWISNLVPLGLGVADGSNYVLYDLLGATGAQGLLVAMVGRARSVLVAFLGLGAMAALTVADRVASIRLQRKLRALRARAAPGAAAPADG